MYNQKERAYGIQVQNVKRSAGNQISLCPRRLNLLVSEKVWMVLEVVDEAVV
jgi:hypothetical protein